MGWLKNAFAIQKPGTVPLTPRQEQLVDRLAARVVEWRMSVPAVMFLESVKPLNFISAQVMVFFSPLVNSLFTVRDYDELVAFLEDRGNIEILLKRIEEKEEDRNRKPPSAPRSAEPPPADSERLSP